MELSHQLLPEQCQVEAVDSAVCVEVSSLPLGLCQRVLAQKIALEENGIGDINFLISINIIVHVNIKFFPFSCRCTIFIYRIKSINIMSWFIKSI